MVDYIRKINYHETDKMGITHHSNYVKFMEESRIDFLYQIGLAYEKFEADGVSSPVVGIEVEYKTPSVFGDTLTIERHIGEYNGIRLTFNYVMRNQNGAIVCKARSAHCFLSGGRICNLARQFPEYDIMLSEAMSL
ncbi:MAG: acyl-CoA thioesterase [Bacteroidales bacterium]|nr:acyl-CoA thioesterase [Bacteroidales bacterium]